MTMLENRIDPFGLNGIEKSPAGKNYACRRLVAVFSASADALTTLTASDAWDLWQYVDDPDRRANFMSATYAAVRNWEANTPEWRAGDTLTLKRDFDFHTPGSVRATAKFKTGEYLIYDGNTTQETERGKTIICDHFTSGVGGKYEMPHLTSYLRSTYFVPPDRRTIELKNFLDRRCELICSNLVKELKTKEKA